MRHIEYDSRYADIDIKNNGHQQQHHRRQQHSSQDQALQWRRDTLCRVLRGCATYDETKALSPKLIFAAEKLLRESSWDEDWVFRLLLATYYQQ